MTGPIARIILRYLAAALVTYGLIPREIGAEIARDPDLILVIGSLIGVATEASYVLAKRRGWTT